MLPTLSKLGTHRSFSSSSISSLSSLFSLKYLSKFGLVLFFNISFAPTKIFLFSPNSLYHFPLKHLKG